MKRCLLIMMLLALLVPFAMAETTDAIDTLPLPDGELQGYTPDELLDMMAARPDEGEEDNSAFLVLPEDMVMPEENTFTLLLVGSDAYSDDKRGRSDTVILAQLNAEKKTVRLASFLRDTYVKIPGKGSNRLNASFSWGGEKLLRKTLETNFGVTADAYVEVNFERLVKVIDAIGGVEIDVSEKERTQVNSILRFYNVKTGARETDQLLEQSGLVRLTGKQALCYSRIRKIDGDFQRTNRQRKVLEAAFHQVTTLNLAEITLLVMGNMDVVNTDLTAADIMELIPLAMRCKNADFESIHIPAEQTYSSRMVDGMYVLSPNLKKNKQILAEFFGLE